MQEAIAAIATGPGRAAIGIVRVSGEGALAAVEKIFRPLSGKALSAYGPGRLTLGTLYDREGNALDQALATFSLAPNSYTGEDTAELHCHGSPTVLNLALEALFAAGVRQAGPGEFTQRAFLNGKLDLCQAEAVIDLIDSQTPAAARAAASQLEGALSRKLEGVYQDLVNLLAHFQAAVDYPDEDIAPFERSEVDMALSKAKEELNILLKSYERGRCLNQGLPCALVGEPNAGKSSLLNALLGYDRAIVTAVPGTTRDTVEERCTLGGTLLRLTDTAGLRETGDEVEKIGVERSRRAMESAGLILVVADGTRPPNAELTRLMEQARAVAPTVLIWNKADAADFALPDGEWLRGNGAEPAESWLRGGANPAWTAGKCVMPLVALSAKTGAGVDKLEETLGALLGQEESFEVYLTNPRQAQQARTALQCLENAQAALAQGFDFDAPLMDVEQAMTALGGLTGREVQNDVVSRVFERFCVGK